MPRSMRINITIDSETLRLADREARRRKTSRSEYIRTAVRDLASGRRAEFEERARQERQKDAIEGMDRLAKRWGDWPAEEILRGARDRWRKKHK